MPCCALRHAALMLQADWDPDRVDQAACQHEEAVNSALRHAGVAKKAALHAQAMLCALEGTELVIPPAPGVSLSHVLCLL